jgi:hypothetical protein
MEPLWNPVFPTSSPRSARPHGCWARELTAYLASKRSRPPGKNSCKISHGPTAR